MLKRISTALFAMAGIGLALPAAAQIEDERFYVAPSFSYSIADGDRLADNGLGGQIGIGKPLTRNLAAEITGFFSSYDGEFSDNTAEFKGVGLALNIFLVEDRPDYYVRTALHYGETSDAPCQTQPGFSGCKNAYDSIVFDFGVGALIRPDFLKILGEGAAFRTEAVYRMDSHEEDSAGRGGNDAFYDGVFTVGLQIPIGSIYEAPKEEEPARVVEAERPECPDYDGTIPEDVAVDEDGCPFDDDNDGVPNFEDECPDTPAGTPVDEVGCALPLSECRPPFPGESVDQRGCASGDTVVLRGVTFDFDSSRITPNARVILDQVADTLLSAEGLTVEIGGHTDSQGSSAYNQKLSQRRAEAVVDFLKERGVAAEQLMARGYGEEEPIASNDTEEGRELNRRVELRILSIEDDV
jgi:OOP family OmpA-OmpF porin